MAWSPVKRPSVSFGKLWKLGGLTDPLLVSRPPGAETEPESKKHGRKTLRAEESLKCKGRRHGWIDILLSPFEKRFCFCGVAMRFS
jgi:hypothetical protein